MKNKCQKLLIFVSVSMCILLFNLAFSVERDGTVKEVDVQVSPQKVGKSVTSASLYEFPWYVIAPGGGSTSSGTHTMKFTSVGQVATDHAQDGGHKIFSGYISTAAPKPVEVKEEDKGQLPHIFELSQNYPNPFNPTTNIRFSLPKPGHVRLDIYNILGRRVTTLVDEDLTEGHKLVTWDGKDDRGNETASGVYFYKLKSGEYTEAKKMVLMR